MAGKKKNRASRATNPNKVNQHTGPDPRQALFLSNYLDPKSPTFSNALQSALAAGFEDTYARNLMNIMPSWLSESLDKPVLISKAVKHLNETLDTSHVVQAMGAFGPVFERKEVTVVKKLKNGKIRHTTKKVQGKPVMVVSSKLLSIKLDAAKFVAERLDQKNFGTKSITNNVVPIQVNFGGMRDQYA